MHELPDPYEDEEDVSPRPDPDPVSEAVGGHGFLTRHIVHECAETFPASTVARFPERFDRFYWQPERVLVDLLDDLTPEALAEARDRKHVRFKTAWCAENGYLYLALPMSESGNVQLIRELLDDARHPAAAASMQDRAKSSPRPSAAPKPRARRKGTIERPKAAA